MANELNAVIQMGGKFLKHAVGVLLLCWRRMLRAGLVAALVAIVLGEIAAMMMTHSLNPGGPAQLAVAALAIALAYGVALTVLVEEFIRGVVETLRLLEGDVAAGARASAVLAEREIGEVHIGLKHLFGLAAPVAWVSARANAARETVAARQEERSRAEAVAAQRRAQEAAVAQRRVAQEQARRDQLAAQTRQRQAAEERARQDRLAEQARVRAERLAQQQQEQADQLEQQRRRRVAEASAAALTAGGATAAAALGAQATHGQRHAAEIPPPPAPHDAASDHPEVSVASVTQLPPVAMQPVPASSLPRIEWTYDHYDADTPPTTAPMTTPNAMPTANTANGGADNAIAASAIPTAIPSAVVTYNAGTADDTPDEPLAPARFAASTDEADDAPELASTEDAASAPSDTALSGADDLTTPAQRPGAWVAPVMAGAAGATVAGIAIGRSDHANQDTSAAAGFPATANGAVTRPLAPRAATRPLAPPDANIAAGGASVELLGPRAADGARGRTTQPRSANTRPLSAATQPLGAITQPLSSVTRPLPAQTRPRPASGGLWERISQALVGRTPAATRPVAGGGGSADGATDPFGDMTPLPPMPAADEDQQ